MLRPVQICLLAASFFVVAGQAQDFYGTTDRQVFRDGRTREMRDPKTTALPAESLATFDGLKYFATNNRLRLRAKLARTETDKPREFQTSSGRVKTYLEFGVVEFAVKGRKLKLTVFKTRPGPIPDKYDDLLFIPFRDATSGKETYAAGRYMSIWIPKGTDNVILDFNLAYNPSCAYGTSRFSCPIPPKENHLPIEIRAGETSYLPRH